MRLSLQVWQKNVFYLVTKGDENDDKQKLGQLTLHLLMERSLMTNFEGLKCLFLNN
jgi:hypothetical protein